MLPVLAGRPIRVSVRPSLGPHLAATSIPRRTVLLDSEVLPRRRGEFERILVHEISLISSGFAFLTRPGAAGSRF